MSQYVRDHLKPIGLLVATLYMAVKPALFDGVTWNEKQWLAFVIFALGAANAFAFANTTNTIARYTKEIVVVSSAVIGTLIDVLPGISRADASTLIVAAAAAVWAILQPNTTQPRATLPLAA